MNKKLLILSYIFGGLYLLLWFGSNLSLSYSSFDGASFVLALSNVATPIFLGILLSRCPNPKSQMGTLKIFALLIGVLSLLISVYYGFENLRKQSEYNDLGLFVSLNAMNSIVYGILRLITFLQIGQLEGLVRSYFVPSTPTNYGVEPLTTGNSSTFYESSTSTPVSPSQEQAGNFYQTNSPYPAPPDYSSMSSSPQSSFPESSSQNSTLSENPQISPSDEDTFF